MPPVPRWAQKFISFVLSPQGQAIMRSNGFVVISPALASSQGKIPAALQPLTTPVAVIGRVRRRAVGPAGRRLDGRGAAQ